MTFDTYYSRSMKTLEDEVKEITPKRQGKIKARTRELVAREMSLRELRHAVNKTQKTLARTLNMGQDGVSRLEKRSDLLLSTLRNYVEAVGGSLTLVAQFPDQEPIAIGGLGDIVTAKENEKAKRRAAPRDEGRVT
jgi:transcriptional regulator with XRE-family HTH domain